MEDCRVVELRTEAKASRNSPAKLHECEIPPDKGENAGGETPLFSFGWIILSRCCTRGSRNEGDEDCDKRGVFNE